MALGRKEEPESPIDWARKRIIAAGYWVKKVEHLFPPLDTYGETEVWFWGRETNTSDDVEQLTAYIPNDPNGEAVIGRGW